jgi:hypothetical protein
MVKVWLRSNIGLKETPLRLVTIYEIPIMEEVLGCIGLQDERIQITAFHKIHERERW